MIRLPSGRLAGISNIRARYHALRLNTRVTQKTPRHDLHRLIDIVLGRQEQQWIPGSPAFVFSGNTLDELPGLENWSLEDRQAFKEWLSQETQIREVESVRQRIVEDELPLISQEFNYPDQLFSALKRRLGQIDMLKASPLQWRDTLLNLRRRGIRYEELEWSGLLAFLTSAHQQGMAFITREELLSRIDFSFIRLRLTNELASDKDCSLEFLEVKHSKSLNRIGAQSRISGPGEVSVLRYVDSLHYYKVGYLKQRGNAWQGDKQWFALDTIDQVIPASAQSLYYNSKEEAFRAASEHALHHVGLPVAYTPCSRYEHKTLCGGDDYREWLLTLPEYPISYYNKHFYERNLLLHFRTKQRWDLQGRRLLFVEEIQSDWHQSGAAKGYQNRWPGELPPAPFSKEWIGLALKLILLHAVTENFDGIAWTKGAVQESHYLQTLKPIRSLYDEQIPRYLKRLLQGVAGGAIRSTQIRTKEPRLSISRRMDKWLVIDPDGSFLTKPKSSQQEAMILKARHCRQIDLEVNMVELNESARLNIRKKRFPLFGTSLMDA
jgi:hypothetical protein